MVRFATAQLRAGHLPPTRWFPYLGLGSPQFLHYQSLPALIAGAIGLVTSPNAAYTWSLYLLLSLWPLTVYGSARLLGAGRGAAAASAAMAPFLWSTVGIGYEQHAYVWTGFGAWTQLWAAVTLPLAWGFCWRWIRDGRHALAAVTLSALTIALHFETGYLALIPLLVWPFVAPGRLVRRIRRAAIVLGGALLASAWVFVPLLDQRAFAAQNEILRGTPLANGYGAGRVLSWLVSGQLLDHGRLPVVTAFAALGLARAIRRCRRDAEARALLVALGICLLLSFGRATFGSLVALIPGSADIFLRRFMMGVQLSALLLAGSGAARIAQIAWQTARRHGGRCADRLASRAPSRRPPHSRRRSSCSRRHGSSSDATTVTTRARSPPSAGPTAPKGPSSTGFTGTLAADRTDVGVHSIPLLHSQLAQHGVDPRVAWGPGQPQPLPRSARATSPGTILSTHASLAASSLSATVRLRSPGAVVLSASYDPGWTATVDGRPEPTVVVAPALVAVRVRAGTHQVVFRYRGYRGYPLLFVVCALTLLAFLAAEALRPAQRS